MFTFSSSVTLHFQAFSQYVCTVQGVSERISFIASGAVAVPPGGGGEVVAGSTGDKAMYLPH